MAPEASWQADSVKRDEETQSATTPLDQPGIEAMLRKLMQRVEESESRYSEALEELHARLDQLAQNTNAASATATPKEAESFDRLRGQLSELARKLETSQDPQAGFDEFAELGRALGSNADAWPTEGQANEPFPGPEGETSAELGNARYATSTPPLFAFETEGEDLDKRLVEIAHRLEHSIDAAMPATALEALNARMEEIASRFEAALSQSPNPEGLQHIERQLAEMGQQLGRAEHQIARINSIEGHLLRLIERLDEAPARIEQMANSAAEQAVKRLIPPGTKAETDAADRFEAIHNDLRSMNERSRASEDRIADTLGAVHESLRELVQKMERGAAGVSVTREPRAVQSPPPRGEDTPGANDRPAARPQDTARRSLDKAGTPDLKADISLSGFGRAKPAERSEEAFDLDAAEARTTPQPIKERDSGGMDDFIAAARRAAQAAAAQAEQRGGGSWRTGDSRSAGAKLAPAPEAQARRKLPILMILAAVLLIASAALLYERLKSKPAEEAVPAPTEQNAPAQPPEPVPAPVPAPSAAPEPIPAPAPVSPPASRSGSSEPALPSQQHATQPSQSGESEMPETVRVGAADTEAPATVATGTGGISEMAKSRRASPPDSETMPKPELASLTSGGEPGPSGMAGTTSVIAGASEPSLPAGVTMTIEEASSGDKAQLSTPSAAAAQAPNANPSMPPAALGPLALRQAAAQGDAKAEYEIALRYAEGHGVGTDWMEAAHWFGLAAKAGLAPAQYRLGVLYERGQGVSKNLAQACAWYQRAAEQGNIKAMHNLAVANSGRDGGNADYAAAVKWYGEAAARGLGDSQFNLAILAQHGLGMHTNLVEAYKWFAIDAQAGDAEAAKQRDLVKAELPADALAQADQAIKAWKKLPAKAEANEVTLEASWQSADATQGPDKILVTRAQALLDKLGYDAGAPDGQLGERTREAVKEFERRNGMQETGEVDVPLVTKLEGLAS